MAELLAVGKVGPAHGVRGEVFLEPWTDDPDARFAAGSVLSGANGTQFRVAGSRYQGARLVVRFAGVDDRAAAEALRATVLYIDAADRPELDDPDDFYDSDLVGLQAVSVDGAPLGPVEDVLHLAGQDYLAVAGHLVPFVAAFVPDVDVAGGRVVLDPPEGLFEL